MKIFGLTGAIGCGKSMVATLLAAYDDVVVFDTDRIAKAIIGDSGYRRAIEAILGADVYGDDGVDFKAIAKIVFTDAEKKKRFEALIHPLVWNVIEGEVAKLEDWQIAIVESAIIFETHREGRFTGVIVVLCDEEKQLRWLREVRKMDDADIQARLREQLPAAEKERRAQFVVHAGAPMDELRRRVSVLYWQLKRAKGAGQ